MKVTVYTMDPSPNPRQTEITLDVNVDLHHGAHTNPEAQLYQLKPNLTLSTAQLIKNQNLSPTQTTIEHLRNHREDYLLTAEQAQTLYFVKIDRSTRTTPSLFLDPEALYTLSQHLQGRTLLLEELLDLISYLGEQHVKDNWRSYIQQLYLSKEIKLVNGLKTRQRKSWLKTTKEYQCLRCGSGINKMYWTHCESCEQSCPYCEECLNMGRTRLCSLVIQGSAQPTAVAPTKQQNVHMNSSDFTLSKWNLSIPQQEAAEQGLRFLQAPAVSPPPCFLIWAVTGAGKTEMIFPFIEAELARGGKVLITTPRRDVVFELKPRLQKAFPNHTHVGLYGGSPERWEEGDITLSTTHQLIRFQHKFDLIIIDEIDAFPFKFNLMLEFVVQQACKSQGRYILLSATPPLHLQQAVRRKQLNCAKVPVRFHRYPLPVPKCIQMDTFKLNGEMTIPLTTRVKAIMMREASTPLAGLHHEIRDSLNRGAQIFLFIPKIKLIPSMVACLRAAHPNIRIEGTSSQDGERADKVQAFRLGEIRILVTTTILERGVTIPKSDVFVLNADSEIFDEAALVQMAGRSGRAIADPIGKVRFFAQDKTRSQLQAIRQIKEMNRLARKKGYTIQANQSSFTSEKGG